MNRTSILIGLLCVLLAGPAIAQDSTRLAVDRNQPEAEAQANSPFGGLVVRLQPDGRLIGTVGHIDPNTLELVAIPGARLQFVQDRRLVAEAVSGPNGAIEIRGLAPRAVYSLIGRAEHEGQRWMIAVGLVVLGPEAEEASASARRSSKTQLTAAKATSMAALEAMAQPQGGFPMVPAGDVGGEGGPPLIGAPAGGGGGGGGGGGHLGAAALGLGIAGLVVALDDDDDELATPFRPGDGDDDDDDD